MYIEWRSSLLAVGCGMKSTIPVPIPFRLVASVILKAAILWMKGVKDSQHLEYQFYLKCGDPAQRQKSPYQTPQQSTHQADQMVSWASDPWPSAEVFQFRKVPWLHRLNMTNVPISIFDEAIPALIGAD